jgi:hypothetical protein
VSASPAPTPPANAPAASDPDKEKRDLLDWAEARGLEYLKEHMSNLESLKADSSSFLTILVAAGGATLAYLLKAPEKHVSAEMVWGAVILLLYFFVLGTILIAKCLTARHAQTVSNGATHLYQEGKFKLVDLKPVEFNNMKERSDNLIARNRSTAQWLNRVRYGALCSPLAFAGGYLAATVVNHYHLFDSVAAMWSRL